MLKLKIAEKEYYDPEKAEFDVIRGCNVSLEHSLISLSKWESKWCKAFLSAKELTPEELLDYIICMTITQNVPAEVYQHLNATEIQQIVDYIEAPMTATTFSEDNKGPKRSEIITSETFYYWMTALNIPFECEKWHLNRLYTLIRLCAIKNQPEKKKSRREVMQENRALNAARRAKMKSKG